MTIRSIEHFWKTAFYLPKSLKPITKLLYTKHLSEFKSLKGLLACQIMPLNKSPGIRPIAKDEVLRRITGKTVILPIKKVEGSLQVCGDQEVGIEPGVRSMVDLLEFDRSTEIVKIKLSERF